MGGWKYEWVGELPQDVYDVLCGMVADFTKQQDQD